MSWLERLDRPYTIITGDGRTYTPKWKNARIIQEYNISTFDFPNVEGTLVVKRQPMGRKFSFEIHFDGEKHLDISRDFEESAKDQRAWAITHPYYDELTVQPQSLTFDNTDYNHTKITGTLLETITTVEPRGTQKPEDEIVERKQASDEAALEAYDQNVETISAPEVQEIDQNVDVLGATTETIIETDSESFNFQNALANAKNGINTAIGQPLNYLRQVQQVINFPFQLVNSVQQRVNLLVDQFNRVVTSLGVVTGLTKSQKSYYEVAGASFISSLAAAGAVNVRGGEQADQNAAGTIDANNQTIQIGINNEPETVPTDSYLSQDDVDETIAKILDAYNDHVARLDEMQTETATDPESFVPNFQAASALQALVSFSVTNLLQIAFDTAVEEVIEVEADTNVIELTHRVYGLDTNDENIERFIAQNQIGNNEMLNIKKGRQIRYYK